MWRDIEELRRYIVRRMLEIWGEIEGEIESMMQTPEELSSIRVDPKEPLHSVYEYEDKYVIVMDMPYADNASLQINAYDRTLEIKAKLKKAVHVDEIGYRFSSGVIQEYRKKITLPPDVDVSKLTYKVLRGRLIITIPKIPR